MGGRAFTPPLAPPVALTCGQPDRRMPWARSTTVASRAGWPPYTGAPSPLRLEKQVTNVYCGFIACDDAVQRKFAAAATAIILVVDTIVLIVAGQQYRKKLDGHQVSKLMDSTCQRPSVCEDNIRQVGG
ncbi:uncharacterized protein LOC110435477 isoform X2 [Sorghum bicolor]|uniref:uncharacterized protein LOC110435477 isoform X2 n=1 Tax=Sorghum bicolor TaxID=4558 RepID=UPI000B42464D|nr:uncharacterized protein LOC110435477 isoform X2 [Sorghum bicolor]|eukprot:XP_021316717.1 uncharacterized protein LOC110435477 isoform X2 [Sorghum bicolor]